MPEQHRGTAALFLFYTSLLSFSAMSYVCLSLWQCSFLGASITCVYNLTRAAELILWFSYIGHLSTWSVISKTVFSHFVTRFFHLMLWPKYFLLKKKKNYIFRKILKGFVQTIVDSNLKRIWDQWKTSL